MITFHGCFKLLAIKHPIYKFDFCTTWRYSELQALFICSKEPPKKKAFHFFKRAIFNCYVGSGGAYSTAGEDSPEWQAPPNNHPLLSRRSAEAKMLLKLWVRNDLRPSDVAKFPQCKGHLPYKAQSSSCARSTKWLPTLSPAFIGLHKTWPCSNFSGNVEIPIGYYHGINPCILI